MAISEEILKKRAEKRAKVVELNAKFFAEQKAKLDEHLRIAKEAAEGKKVVVQSGSGTKEIRPSGEVKSAVPLSTTTAAAPKIKMATGWKPKAPTVVQPQSLASMTSHKGFKPLQKAPSSGGISISVAAVHGIKSTVTTEGIISQYHLIVKVVSRKTMPPGYRLGINFPSKVAPLVKFSYVTCSFTLSGIPAQVTFIS